MQKKTLLSLTVFLGLIFLVSAYLKLRSIELLELNLVETGLIKWDHSAFFSRVIIAFELFLGILLILNFKLKTLTLKFSLGLLTFFTIYLVIILIKNGNRGNCNCFGALVNLNPFESIIKNIFLIFINLILIKLYDGIRWRHQIKILGTVALISILLPFIINPPGLNTNSKQTQKFEPYKMDLSQLSDDFKNHPLNGGLHEGKRIIVFLSLSCPHCIICAYKLHLIKRENPSIPIYFVVNGKLSELSKFLEETRSYNVPQTMLRGPDFIKLSGTKIPTIFYFENGMVVSKMNYREVNQRTIEKWLSLKIKNYSVIN